MCRESFYGDYKSYIQSVIHSDRTFGGSMGNGQKEERESVLDLENGSCKLLFIAGDFSHLHLYDSRSDCCIRDRHL